VVECEDGAAALRALEGRACGFDAVLLDRTLPDIGGEQVLRSIRERCGDLPVVLCSGHDHENRTEPRAPDANLLDARKPYDLEAVLGWALRRRSPGKGAGSGRFRA
jgi:two-component system cell cycle response regulator CtrA